MVCERCEDTGVVGYTDRPITCTCRTGMNAHEANPDWYVMESSNQEAPKPTS